MASPFFDLAQLWQQGQQQQQRQALLQLEQQNQQLRARQVLAGLAEQQRQRREAAIGMQTLRGLAPLPGGGALGAGPQPLDMTPMPSGAAPLPQVPNAGAQMASPGLADLQKQVLNLEGNKDYARGSYGELGPGQILPSTGAQYGYLPSQLLGDAGRQASARIVSDLYSRSGGDPAATLVGYNRGAGAMARFQAAGDNLGSLKTGLAPAYQKAVLADLSPEQQQQGSQVAVDVATRAPPQFAGRLSIQQIAQMVDRTAGPEVDDETKFGAVAQLYKLMNGDAQQQFQRSWEMYKFGAEQSEKGREFGIRQSELEETRKQNADFRQQMIDIQRGRLQVTQDKAAQAQAQQQQFSEGDVDYWAKVLKSGGHLPPGLARTAAGSQFVQRVMAKIPGISGGDPGAFIENASAVKADTSSLNNMTKMADSATSFERTANMNFDTALRLSKDAVPTDWGPWLNKFIETGETQAGNTEIPPYVTAMLTAANEYAKIMSGSTGSQGSTVDSRREAAELFSPYLSAGQIDRVVAIAKNDMANRKRSLYGQIDDIKARLHSAGSGEPTATQGQPGAAQPPSGDTMPVPPAFTSDPDGTGYKRGNDVWVKRGNQLVKTPGAVSQ